MKAQLMRAGGTFPFLQLVEDTPQKQSEFPPSSNTLTFLVIFPTTVLCFGPSILSTGNTNGKDRTKYQPLLLAQRKICSKYYIFDVSKSNIPYDELLSLNSFKAKDDPRFVGKLQRIRRDTGNYVCYSLFEGRHEEQVQVATVMYEIPPGITILKKSNLRKAHMVIASAMPAAYKGGDEVVMDKKLLAEVVNSHIDKQKTLAQYIDHPAGIYVSTTKVATRGKDGLFRIYFRGRGRGSSNENMQLTDHHHKDDCSLQMVAFDNTLVDYSVDYTTPFNAFQAFGFAICQFDL